MEEEDDDFYAPQEHIPSASTSVTAAEKSHNEPRTEDGHRNRTDQKMTDDLEEGEEEDADESDSVSLDNSFLYLFFKELILNFIGPNRTLISSLREKMAQSQSLHRR